MVINKDKLQNVRQRKYLGRDFDQLRAQLLQYASLYYPDKIKDFSEQSLGGILLDLAAYVGDNLSFYLDHQYGELNPNTAVENSNIERHLNTAGVPIVGSAPATVPVTIFIEIPAQTTNNTIIGVEEAYPVIEIGSIFEATNGTQFVLVEDIDFSETKTDGSLKAEIKVGQRSSFGIPTTFILARTGLCVSGLETSETISLGTTFTPFKKITLQNANVSQIINVFDGLGNEYYEVSDLTNDVVYKNVLNTAGDNDLVRDSVKIIPAPYRFTKSVDISSRRTILTLGGGDANTLEDDIIPDPSDFAISLPYTQTFSRIPVNPNQLLTTNTLGVAATNTSLTITYRYGGGLSHNVPANSVTNVVSLKTRFPGNPSASIAGAVRSSIEVTNKITASGGDDAPTIDDLVELLPSIKNSQERIVTREDLLARVYTLPSNFGRVFRAAVRSNQINPLATKLYIISRDENSRLIISPDTLKQNLIRYLNPYRMISDAIDILDARVINIQILFDVLIDPLLNRNIVLQNILTRLQTTFNIKNFNIDQPIILSEIRNVIYAVNGVISVNNIEINNITGVVNNRSYSNVVYNINQNIINDIILPPEGGIFECRYTEFDIIGKTTTT